MIKMKANAVPRASSLRTHVGETKDAARTIREKNIPNVAEDAVSFIQATLNNAATIPPNQGRPSRARAKQTGHTSKGRASTDLFASTRSTSFGFVLPTTARYRGK